MRRGSDGRPRVPRLGCHALCQHIPPPRHPHEPTRRTRGVISEGTLDRRPRDPLAQRCLNGRMDVLGSHRLVLIGQHLGNSLQHPNPAVEAAADRPQPAAEARRWPAQRPVSRPSLRHHERRCEDIQLIVGRSLNTSLIQGTPDHRSRASMQSRAWFLSVTVDCATLGQFSVLCTCPLLAFRL